MNKILLLVSTVALVACGSWTVQNNMATGIKVGDTIVSAGACETLSDNFFGGVWPATITKEDGSATAKDGKADEKWEGKHYVVDANGSIIESETACEEPEKPAPEGTEPATPEGTEPATPEGTNTDGAEPDKKASIASP